jgi:hypothetical protein
MEESSESALSPRGRYSLATRLAVAAVSATVLTAAQFGAFDCSGVPLLSIATGILAFGFGAFGIASLISRNWASGILSVVVAILSFPVMLLSHMCG